MIRPARLVLVLSLVVLTATPMAAAEDRWGLDHISDQLAALRARIQELAEKASKDPRELLLDKYLRFTADAWKDKKREPRVKDMLEWVFSKDCHPDLREATANALIKNVFKDPDLSSERKGRQSPRAKLSEREIVPQLRDKDPISRKLANVLLVGFWGKPREPEARNYRWNEGSKRTWVPAYKAWKKILERK